jgi:hypothetical protein
MPEFDPLTIFYSNLEEVRRIQEHIELINEFNGIISQIESSGRATDENLNELKNILKRYWRRCISNLYTKINDKIQNRFWKGQIYSDNIESINEARNRSETDLEIGDYREIFFDLIDNETKVDEKIYAEKYAIKVAIASLIIGFFLGICVSWVSKSYGWW